MLGHFQKVDLNIILSTSGLLYLLNLEDRLRFAKDAYDLPRDSTNEMVINSLSFISGLKALEYVYELHSLFWDEKDLRKIQSKIIVSVLSNAAAVNSDNHLESVKHLFKKILFHNNPLIHLMIRSFLLEGVPKKYARLLMVTAREARPKSEGSLRLSKPYSK